MKSPAIISKRVATEVRDGAIRVPIYPMGDGRWCIVYRDSKKGPRKRILRKTLAEAKTEARDLCTKIANGRLAADDLSPQDRVEAAAAKKTLQPLGLSIDAAARELAEAHKLSGGAGILELARFWAKNHQAALSRKPIEKIHADLLHTMGDHGLSVRYWEELDRDLGKFCAAFKGRLAGEILSAEILEYLRELKDRHGKKVGWRRRNKIHSLIITLFRFAKTERHLAQDRDTEPELVAKLGKPRDAPPPRIFTPGELRIILANVEPDWLPWIVLGAFAGLRTAEILRLDWSDVLHQDALIHIREAVAKRTSRKHGDARYVPMPDNLRAWLKPWENETGPICDKPRVDRFTGKLGKLLPGGHWGKNPLRHSWVSYRAAETANLPQVADEAGNSTEISRTAYRNPRMKREAVAWFNIYPDTETPGNVVEMKGS